LAALEVIVSEDHVGHAPAVEVQGGVALPAFDKVERIGEIVSALTADGGYEISAPARHGREPILRVHDGELVEFLADAWDRLQGARPPGAPLVFADTFAHERLRSGLGPLGPDRGVGDVGRFCFDTITGIGAATFAAACAAVDVAVSGAERLLAGAPAVLGLTRPPGHHVSRDLFGGGCYLNNAAIAAQRLRDRGVGRVAILDLDYHHGNGTQSLFYDRGDVLYASLHGAPERAYPYFLGFAEERGNGEGEGATINVPLPAGVTGDAYRAMLAPVLERVRDFEAGALVVSLGLDTVEGDPSGDAALSTGELEMTGHDVGMLALPSLILLEGGYDVARIGADTAAWLNGYRSR
jgi:acetoin utilization deacetylase AcuC-like enzyme